MHCTFRFELVVRCRQQPASIFECSLKTHFFRPSLLLVTSFFLLSHVDKSNLVVVLVLRSRVLHRAAVMTFPGLPAIVTSNYVSFLLHFLSLPSCCFSFSFLLFISQRQLFFANLTPPPPPPRLASLTSS